MHLLLVASIASSSKLATNSDALASTSDALVTSSYLLLVVMPGATSSFLLLVVRHLRSYEYYSNSNIMVLNASTGLFIFFETFRLCLHSCLYAVACLP